MLWRNLLARRCERRAPVQQLGAGGELRVAADQTGGARSRVDQVIVAPELHDVAVIENDAEVDDRWLAKVWRRSWKRTALRLAAVAAR